MARVLGGIPKPQTRGKNRMKEIYFSTLMAAAKIGVDRNTLIRWQKRGYVAPAIAIELGSGRMFWGWSQATIAQAKALKGKTNTHGAVRNV
jgi:hypothetical protein